MRIENKFSQLKQQARAGLVTYIMAYDNDRDTSQYLLNNLPKNGADFIELGMPFSDPVADGVIIQDAAIRALKAGAKLKNILQMVSDFRMKDDVTPIILMGYYNPLQKYGLEKFTFDAKKAGVDAFLIVDLPPEEDEELFIITKKNKINLIKLVTPTTDDDRLQLIAKKASGFIYYVSVAGVTGTKSASYDSVDVAIKKIKKHITIPVAVGFGIKTKEDVKAISRYSDAVIVGSSLIKKLQEDGKESVLSFVKNLSNGLK